MTQVNIIQRITELMGQFPEIEYETGEVVYSFQNGYEKLNIRRNDQGGRSEFSGTYHPSVVCEGYSVCKWCGTIL